MGYKYLGPSDVFIFDDKAYKQGDEIPISQALARHHVINGHRFEEVPEETPALAPVAVAAEPKGDQGEVLDVAEPRRGKRD